MKDRAIVLILEDTLEKIRTLDPEVDSTDGYNEWGEAECFKKARSLAANVLHLVAEMKRIEE